MDELFGGVPATPRDDKLTSRDNDKADVARVEISSHSGDRNA